MNKDFLITGINRIVYVAGEEYPEKTTAFSSNLAYNEIIFHISGNSTVYFDKKVLNVQENMVRFLPSGRWERYVVEKQELSRGEQRGDCILIAFSADRAVSGEAFVQSVGENKRIGDLFKKAFALWVAKGEGYYFECMSLTYKIFAELQKKTYLPDKKFSLIKPAVDYIGENFLRENISCDRLCTLCGISYTYLKRLFIEKYALPPKKYIIRMRINYACELLKEGATVTDTAAAAGFTDVYFFSRQFKEYMGISPTEYMKKYKSGK